MLESMPPRRVVVIRADKIFWSSAAWISNEKNSAANENPGYFKGVPSRRGEPAVQRERSHQTCVPAFECTLPCHWAEKPWEQAFMEITGCNGQGTPEFADRDGLEARENGFGHESLNGRCSLGLFLFGLQELISTTFSSTGFFWGGWSVVGNVQFYQNICSTGENHSPKWLS